MVHEHVDPRIPFWPSLATCDFFFFILKKIKISKIYGHFKKLQKLAPVAHGEGDRPFL